MHDKIINRKFCLVGDISRKRDHWGDIGVDGRIMLKWAFRNWDVGVWTGSSWLRIGTVAGHVGIR